jgi:hypothetical protein
MSRNPRSRTAVFRLALALDDAFGLFTAEGERALAPGWDPESLSTTTTRGGVFRTRTADVTTTWIVCRWEPQEGRVGYARLGDGEHAGLVDVQLERVDSAHTDVRVTYTLTGLTDAGNELVDAFLAPNQYAAFVAGWKKLIEAGIRRQAGRIQV